MPECVASGDNTNSGDELARGCVLEQEAAGAGVERLVDVFVEVEGAEYEDPGDVRVVMEEPAGGLQPVELGHADVHEDHVGVMLVDCGDGFVAVAGFGDHFEAGLGFEDACLTVLVSASCTIR